MSNANSKVDMAQRNAAIDKVLSLPTTTQAEVKERRRNSRKIRQTDREVAPRVRNSPKRKGNK